MRMFRLSSTQVIVTSLVVAVLCQAVAEAHGGGCRSTLRLSTGRLTRSRAALVFVVQSNVRFVPFAIPVAVPVAVVNAPSVVYGYSGYSAAYQSRPTVEPQRVEPQPSLTAAEVVTNRCVKCHSGDEPKAGFDLSFDPEALDGQGANLIELDRDTRYRMLRRIMEPDKRNRMPKGGELSREEFDALVDALVR